MSDGTVTTSLKTAPGYYSVRMSRLPPARRRLVPSGWLSTGLTTSRGSRASAPATSARIANAACSTRRGGQGRSAFYDDYHLSQLKTINQLLRKGFNCAHIAEFFARMREGHDLAAILGVQQAILGSTDDGTRAAAVAARSRPGKRRSAAAVVAAGWPNSSRTRCRSPIRRWPRSSRVRPISSPTFR